MKFPPFIIFTVGTYTNKMQRHVQAPSRCPACLHYVEHQNLYLQVLQEWVEKNKSGVADYSECNLQLLDDALDFCTGFVRAFATHFIFVRPSYSPKSFKKAVTRAWTNLREIKQMIDTLTLHFLLRPSVAEAFTIAQTKLAQVLQRYQHKIHLPVGCCPTYDVEWRWVENELDLLFLMKDAEDIYLRNIATIDLTAM